MFQSTRPRGARPWRSRRPRFRPGCFNPRARAGRDLRWTWASCARFPFQSTRPRGARRKPRPKDFVWFLFQSTRPRGARPPSCSHPRFARRCFNPGARAGRDGDLVDRHLTLVPVSIHAPARGATSLLPIRPFSAQVSIHAPARGATRWRVADYRCGACFNPRARAGRDRYNALYGGAGSGFQSTRPRGARRGVLPRRLAELGVSIHAPARGATHVHLRWRPGKFVFQSTRPRGARPDHRPQVKRCC